MPPRRGEVYEMILDPVQGTEQGGVRPVVIVSHNALNEVVPRILGVPCTSHRGRAIHPTNVLVAPPEGGLVRPSLVLCEQVRILALSRMRRRRGVLSAETMAQVDRALAIALDLPTLNPEVV